MSLFDVIKYPFLPGQNFRDVGLTLPQNIRMAFYTHPEYISDMELAYCFGIVFHRNLEHNNNLLKKVILEWEGPEE
jgi:hypothetical protein